MFDDLNEYEYVIELLAEHSTYPSWLDISDLTGQKSELVRRLNDLLDSITEKEKKTIAAPAGKYGKRNLAVGFSWESGFICELLSDLQLCWNPIDLESALPRLERDFLKAMVIACDLKREGVEFKYMEIKPDAELGKKVKKGGEKGRNTAAKDRLGMRNLWQQWVNDVFAKHPDWSFEDIKRQVIKEHSCAVSASQLKRYTQNPKKNS